MLTLEFPPGRIQCEKTQAVDMDLRFVLKWTHIHGCKRRGFEVSRHILETGLLYNIHRV